MSKINDVEEKLNLAKHYANELKNHVDWLKENDFVVDVDALKLIYGLDDLFKNIEIKGGICK